MRRGRHPRNWTGSWPSGPPWPRRASARAPCSTTWQPPWPSFTLLCLYDAAGLPFTLVLLPNQEDRAMDAARETGQGLLLLGWTGEQEGAVVRRIALFGDATRSPRPGDLFGRTGS